jgi:hypothetical protein
MKKIPTAIEEDLSSSANQTDSLFNESNEVSSDTNGRLLNGSAVKTNPVAVAASHKAGYSSSSNGHENNGHSITDDEEDDRDEEVQVESENVASQPQKASSPNGKRDSNGQNGRSINKVCFSFSKPRAS